MLNCVFYLVLHKLKKKFHKTLKYDTITNTNTYSLLRVLQPFFNAGIFVHLTTFKKIFLMLKLINIDINVKIFVIKLILKTIKLLGMLSTIK